MPKRAKTNLVILVFCSGLLIWAAVVLRHYFQSYPGYFIALHFLDISLLNVGALLLIAAVAWLGGRAILKLLRFKTADGEEEFLLANATGFATITYLFILAGVLHLYYPAFAYGGLGFIFLLSLLILRKDVIKPLRVSATRTQGAHLTTLETVFIILLSIEIIVNFLYSLVPPTSHDALMMHLLWPKRFIEKAQISTRLFPLNAHILYTMCMLTKGEVLAKLLNFYFSLLALGSVYWLARKISGQRWIALLAALVFYSQPVTAYVSRRAYTDIYLVFYETMALGLLIDYLKHRGNVRLLLLALFLGYALGVKYLSLFVLPAFAAVLLIHFIISEQKKWPARLGLGIAKALGIGLLILLFSVWSIQNLVITSNPVYPIFPHIIPTKFPKPKKQENFQLRYGQLSPDELHKIRLNLGDQWRQGAHLNPRLKGWLTLPWKLTMSTEYPLRLWGNIILPIYLILLPFIVFLRRKQDWLIMAFIVSFFTLWTYGVQHIRYAIPALAWLSYICALSLSLIPARLVRAVFLGIILVILGCYGIFELISLNSPGHRPYLYILGLENREDYLMHSQIKNIYAPISDLNQLNKSEPVKLICFADSRVYYCDFPVAADNPNFDYTLLFPRICRNDPQAAVELLKKNGYTHLLFNRASLHDLFIRGQAYGRIKALQRMAIEAEDFLNKTIALGLEKTYDALGIEIYQIPNDKSRLTADFTAKVPLAKAE